MGLVLHVVVLAVLDSTSSRSSSFTGAYWSSSRRSKSMRFRRSS